MGRCIIVLGIPRSGTSCLAGVLHHLGVDMGSGFLQQGNEWNPKGYYEDLRWQRLNKQITGERYSLEDKPTDEILKAYEALARECNQKPLWGMKDPRLCVTLKYILPHLESFTIICTARTLRACALSLKQHSERNYGGQYRMNYDQAYNVIQHWADEMWDRIGEFRRPGLLISYNDLVSYPETEVARIARLLFPGVKLSTGPAVRFINKELMHHGA